MSDEGVPLKDIRAYKRLKKSHVRSAETGGYEERPWTHPLLVAVCAECAYRAVSVSIDASNAAIWDHAVAVHLRSSCAAFFREEAEV